MLTDYLATGPQEIFNTVRLRAYLENVGSPFTTGSDICGCDTLTRAMLEDSPASPVYDTPATDPAPWYDPDLPETTDFLGFLPLSITGLNDNPRARNVTNAVGGGGIFGPSRALPRTMVVTGLLIGASCCAAEFGMHYLAEALAGCSGDACDGDCIEMFNCCPDATSTRAEFLAKHRRTFRRTSLVSGPTETNRVGDGTCARGTCGAGGDIIEVEFTLVAASPWPWTDPVPLLDVGLPIGGTGACVEWCLSPGSGASACNSGECKYASCTGTTDPCADPTKVVPSPPVPTQPEASFCVPLVSERACYAIDLSTRPQWSSDVPVITLSSGSSELRNVRVTFYQKADGSPLTCDQVADAGRCDPHSDFYINYVPRSGTVTIDGRVNQATLDCNGECQSASTVFGSADGGPLRINEINCANLCVCIETDVNFPPAADATFSLSVAGRGY